MELADIVNFADHPIKNPDFGADCKLNLDRAGVLVLANFIQRATLDTIRADCLAQEDQAYFRTQSHSVYLTEHNAEFPEDHPANRQVTSSKGCVCDDQVGPNSPLRQIYEDPSFQAFVAQSTGQKALFPYADTLSSINVHYAKRGQELGWHFDNSSFAITLLIQKPDQGSRFEYLKDLRDADQGDMNYLGVADLLDGRTTPKSLEIEPGTLVLFRGRNSIHRVSPNESKRTRILAVLAYNDASGVALSESARMTFYGRLD